MYTAGQHLSFATLRRERSLGPPDEYTAISDSDPVLMRSVGTIVFDLHVFVFQFLLHLAGPVGTALYMCTFGPARANNQDLHLCVRLKGCDPGTWLRYPLAVDPLLLIIHIILYVRQREDFSKGGVEWFEILAWPTFLFVVHKIMVAFKYAMLTKEEYQAFMDAPYEIAARWNLGLQLITGWGRLADELIDAEMDSASELVGIEIDECDFIHEVEDHLSLKEWSLWESVLQANSYERSISLSVLEGNTLCQHLLEKMSKLCPENVQIPVEVHRLDGKQLFRRLLQLADSYAYRPQASTLILGALTFCCWPFAHRLSTSWSKCSADSDWMSCASFRSLALIGGGDDWRVTYCVIAANYLSLRYFATLMNFVTIGVTHFHRIALLLHLLAQLARPVIATYPNIPRLQLEGKHTVHNVTTLVSFFELAVRFGRRYKYRLDAYIMTLIVTMFLTLGFMYVGLAILIKTSDKEDDDTDFGVWVPTTSLGACYAVTLSTALLVSMILHGSFANDCFRLLAHHLTTRRWRRHLRSCTADSADQTAYANDDIGNVFDIAQEKLTCLGDVYPLRIAAFQTTSDLAYGLASVVLPVVALVLGKLFFPELLTL